MTTAQKELVTGVKKTGSSRRDGGNPEAQPAVLVRSIYGKYPLNPKKLLQKASQLILVELSVLYNILNVYQSRAPGKVFYSRWRPRWPPKPLNDHNYVTVNSPLMILVSIPRFSWGKVQFKIITK